VGGKARPPARRGAVTKQRVIVLASLFLCATAHAEDEDAAMGRRGEAALRAHQADVFGCVQKEPAPPKGEMLVRVFIGEAGRDVARAEVLKDQTSSQTLRRCIGDKI